MLTVYVMCSYGMPGIDVATVIFRVIVCTLLRCWNITVSS